VTSSAGMVGPPRQANVYPSAFGLRAPEAMAPEREPVRRHGGLPWGGPSAHSGDEAGRCGDPNRLIGRELASPVR
jgi:hypothetical protein